MNFWYKKFLFIEIFINKFLLISLINLGWNNQMKINIESLNLLAETKSVLKEQQN
jgi:hypothetical protein